MKLFVNLLNIIYVITPNVNNYFVVVLLPSRQINELLGRRLVTMNAEYL